MTRSDLIDKLAEKMSLNMETAGSIILEIFGSMTETLIAGDGIEIRGFGSFQVRDYEGYTGRNPKTGLETVVAPKKLPVFRVGKELKERIMESDS